MRTRFIIILTLCLALCLAAVSCNADSTLRDDEVLVSVSFDNGSARSLSASLESFDTEDYFWYYKATKADGDRFKSGQTEGFVALQDDRGLCNDTGRVKISGFSQGLWTFELEAYAGEGMQDLVYNRNGDLVRTHKRSYTPKSWVVIPSDMPKEYKDYGYWTVPYFLQRAADVGPQTRILMDNVIKKFDHPVQSFRSCFGILKLADKHGKTALENCCRDAVLAGKCSYTYVANTIASYDEEPEPTGNYPSRLKSVDTGP